MKCPKCNKFKFVVDDTADMYVSTDGSVVSLTIKCTNCGCHVVNDYHQAITLHHYAEGLKDE